MTKLIFDIETDGLNPSVVWCIAVQIEGQPWNTKFFGPREVYNFPEWLIGQGITTLIGHNIISFDIPVLEKLLHFKWKGEVEDTLVMSRLDNPSRKGGHSLNAWGEKLELLKGNFNKWDEYSEEMKEYCIQDVKVTAKVYSLLSQQNINPKAFKLEQEVAYLMNQQKENGWQFDTMKAISLLADLKQEMFKAEDEVREVFIPIPIFKPTKFPERPYTQDGEISSALLNQLDKLSFFHEEKGWGHYIAPEFNLGSRQQIAKQLVHFGWEPTEFTEKGATIVSEKILEDVDFHEGKLIAKYLMLQKRLAMVSSWVDAIDFEDRIHGNINSCGAVTGRMTHSKPNLAQVPSSSSPYGMECRSLFKVNKGYKLVGCDAASLELRMLAHYMNDEEYTKEVSDGDIHTANQMAAGLESRDKAKTFIYAFLYGAGDRKIGEIVGGSNKEGKTLKTNFLNNTPALKDLRERITKLSTKGTIEGLDGRKLHIRSSHAALNTLFQSAGAIVMKKALLILNSNAKKHRIDYRFVGNIHDEIQTEVREDQAKFFGEIAVASIKEAGEFYGLNCKLDGEFKVGATWAETH